MTVTAPNESQKPAVTTAHGSTSTTRAAAQAKTSDGATLRPNANAVLTTTSIHSARCAGTLKPASAA
jgi:hypothetical protein